MRLKATFHASERMRLRPPPYWTSARDARSSEWRCRPPNSAIRNSCRLEVLANSSSGNVERPNVTEHRPAASIEAVESGLAAQGYIASRQIATAVYLADQIEKPILVEG